MGSAHAGSVWEAREVTSAIRRSAKQGGESHFIPSANMVRDKSYRCPSYPPPSFPARVRQLRRWLPCVESETFSRKNGGYVTELTIDGRKNEEQCHSEPKAITMTWGFTIQNFIATPFSDKMDLF